MKQTAVEWLAIQLHTHWGNEDVSFEKLIEQAKAMEKEQIIKAHYAEEQDAEQYYNETYKK